MRKALLVVCLFFACNPVVIKQADSPYRLRDYPNVFIVPCGISMEDVLNFNLVLKDIGFCVVEDPRWADAIILITHDRIAFKNPAFTTLAEIKTDIPCDIKDRAQIIKRYF